MPSTKVRLPRWSGMIGKSIRRWRSSAIGRTRYGLPPYDGRVPSPEDSGARAIRELAAEVRALAERVEAVHRRVQRDEDAARVRAQTLLDALEHVYDDDRA